MRLTVERNGKSGEGLIFPAMLGKYPGNQVMLFEGIIPYGVSHSMVLGKSGTSASDLNCIDHLTCSFHGNGTIGAAVKCPYSDVRHAGCLPRIADATER